MTEEAVIRSRHAAVPVPHPARAWVESVAGVALRAGITSGDAFLLRYGLAFPAARRGSYPGTGVMKQCFKNCADAVFSGSRLIYCEGIVMCYGVPIDHAWLVNSRGIVTDPTIRLSKGEGPLTYFGIPFCETFVRMAALVKGEYGVLQNHSRRLFSMLDYADLPGTFLHPAFR